MICYEKAGDDVNDLLGEAIRLWHPELKAIDIGVLFAFSRNKDGESTGKQPLKGMGGKAASAKVKLVKAADRLFKKIDAEIHLDGDFWKEQPREVQISILDHELEHIVLVDKEESEDDGRPKLRLKDDEYVVWGFSCIARRHGEHSMEVKGMSRLMREYGEVLLTDKVRAILANPQLADAQKVEALDDTFHRGAPSRALATT